MQCNSIVKECQDSVLVNVNVMYSAFFLVT